MAMTIEESLHSQTNSNHNECIPNHQMDSNLQTNCVNIKNKKKQGDRETSRKSNEYVGTPNTHQKKQLAVAGLGEALWDNVFHVPPFKAR